MKINHFQFKIIDFQSKWSINMSFLIKMLKIVDSSFKLNQKYLDLNHFWFFCFQLNRSIFDKIDLFSIYFDQSWHFGHSFNQFNHENSDSDGEFLNYNPIKLQFRS